MKRCERLDKLLVDKGLAQSRERAKTIIMAGMVMVGDRVVDKAGILVERDSHIRFKGSDHPYVSRGGLKLEEALRGFQVDPTDKVAMDLPIVCSKRARRGYTPSTWAMGNWPGD
jgi:23S rRNA (cytidine1920-2'-O)/16S rRNA (cytidine1409-2'-O)-methyltransferase